MMTEAQAVDALMSNLAEHKRSGLRMVNIAEVIEAHQVLFSSDGVFGFACGMDIESTVDLIEQFNPSPAQRQSGLMLKTEYQFRHSFKKV